MRVKRKQVRIEVRQLHKYNASGFSRSDGDPRICQCSSSSVNIAQEKLLEIPRVYFRPGSYVAFLRLSNAIETIDNEMICFVIYCLNCIRSTAEMQHMNVV